MIFNNFFFQNNFTVNNIVDNAVTWKFHKGFAAYFNKITTKQQKRKGVYCSKLFQIYALNSVTVSCTVVHQKLTNCTTVLHSNEHYLSSGEKEA